MNNSEKISSVLVTAFVAIVIVGPLVALPTMWMWNAYLVPAISGVHEVTWNQAWGLNILFGILFKPTIPNIKTDFG
jgi:hypothetical protein